MFERIAHAFGLDDFNKRHKVGFVMLIIAMLAVVVVWIIQLKQNIVSPLYGNLNQQAATNQVAGSTQESELRAKDTDSDALSDWDELNLYKTSPYLADSDSDTFGDKQEIDSGNDPNCPQGQTCVAVTGEGAPSDMTDFTNPGLDDLLNRTTGTNVITNTVTPTASPSSTSLTEEEKNALRQALGNTKDPKALRQLLVQAGMDQATLNSLSDEQLLATFEELIK